jgi:hypothetical protein
MGQDEAGALFRVLSAAMPDGPCVQFHVRRLREGAAGAKMVMTEK